MLMIWPDMYACPDEVQTVWCRHICMLFVWFQLQTSRASCKDLLCYLSGVYYYQGMQIIWKNTVPSQLPFFKISKHPHIVLYSICWTIFLFEFAQVLQSCIKYLQLLIKLFVWLKTFLLHLTFLCYFCEKSA